MKLKNNPAFLIIAKSVLVFVLFFITVSMASAQMPPPGYERAKKMQEERMKISPLDRDSITRIDTVVIFDGETYEEEIKVVQTRISIRDYCVLNLGMGNPDILLDGQPHTIIDPRTYNDMTIRLNQAGKIDTIPK
jgi:hypothetical protein